LLQQDLVVATRHILQSELRSAFLGQIDTLLDDHVLVGNSVTGYENLRPLAYSMLADLIHHVRADLTVEQLARIVHTYSANIHDPTLAAAIQTMCSKLLLNLIDPISSKDPNQAVKILQRIQVAFVSKMEAMAEVRDEWGKWAKVREPLPVVMAEIEKRERDRKEKEKERIATGGEDGMEIDAKEVAVVEAKEDTPLPELDDVDIERAKPMRKAMVMVDPGPDPVKGALLVLCSRRRRG
jgi:transformation/transcription domain-associated protein